MRVQVLPLAVAISLATPAVAASQVPHVVEPGESLSSIAAADGLTVEELAAANGVAPDEWLVAGSTVMVPGHAEEASTPGAEEPSAPAAEVASTPAAEEGSSEAAHPVEGGAYVVQPGDTLSAIAARSGTTVASLAALNGIDPNELLLTGTALNLGGGASEGAPAEASSSEGAEPSSPQPPYPTSENVSPSEVGSVAEENGVPSSFAEAIAQQESGFNNDLTSSADARGVMQILPGTWEWINNNLAGSTPLAPASAASNVRGGVLLLNSLLNQTGGDQGLAAAGYYQGLESVLSEGELPSTQRYVESVRALQGQFGGE
jgi:LysM repeat protein